MGIYTDYFQKSKVFLYPLLKLKKGLPFVPKETYVAWDNVYSVKDCRFFCLYRVKFTDKFKRFITEYLENNPYFEDYVELNKSKHLFIFDFTPKKHDYERFISGKYSQLTLESKVTILDFFANEEKVSDYVQGFLSPESMHQVYADFLAVTLETLENVYETCTPPDLEKETLIDNNLIIQQLLKRSSISLTNK
jgi:hypothetical protein|tara:strand:- start:129 stop:707 length:579 start_codon:yes stop_codon:yes gene_type:complete